MADTVSFKVFLTKEEEPEAKPEVRRFGIDKDVVTNFLYFNEKLQTVFSGLRSRRFTISWKGKTQTYQLLRGCYALFLPTEQTHPNI